MAIGSTSSAADSNPPWTRWLMPSVGDLLFMTFLGLLACTNLSTRLLGDAGIGWHIRSGQLILATHTIPRTDPFSSSMSGHPWFAWEWLYDVVVGWVERATGLNGVVLVTGLIIAATFSWTFRLLLRRGSNVLLALILVLLAASASMIHFLTRPHVASWLFSVAWFWIIDSSDKDATASRAGPPQILGVAASRDWLLWLLPILMLVWVNVHGGFLIAFALLAIYWASAAWLWLRLSLKLSEDRFDDFLRKAKTATRLRHLSWTAILCAAATFVNPYGFKLHVHIYRYLSNRFLMEHIDEFQSPNFHYVAQKCFAALLLLTVAALAAKRREPRVRVSEGLVILFAVYSGLYASRNIPISSLLLILVIAPWLEDAIVSFIESRQGRSRGRGFEYKHFLGRMQAIELSLRGHLWPVAAIVLTCWIAMHSGRLGATKLMDAHFDAKRFSVAAVDYLEKADVRGPVLSPDYWGGYLIYRLYPRMKVVMDDRHDFYGEDFLRLYLKMVRVEPGWDEFIREHPAQCVVVPKDSALANILSETAGWRPIYHDNVAVMFVRILSPRE